ncbi:hypothetical protein A5886_001490 [Enterococcus sp. 8G7_MSG3316]|uniref:Uncharacterized protein n=1 Tax=Candidatus Enterococcus testudinis TaxID=1834191 RepID=A0A242A724_9ENTE|nr:hypothetical protein [Enterococcus sp. 8G7_MSG3316]OTN76413.1 hypothetical protein A5886_001490 [Enterococcus sp. 8G7_MSG3316]
MFNKFKKPKTNIVSLMIYFFLLFYVGSVIKKLIQGEFEILDGWHLLNLLLFLCITYWLQQVRSSAVCIGIYSSYMFIVGCLFAFVFGDVPLESQTVALYLIGAFFGGILWYLIAKSMLGRQ